MNEKHSMTFSSKSESGFILCNKKSYLIHDVWFAHVVEAFITLNWKLGINTWVHLLSMPLLHIHPFFSINLLYTWNQVHSDPCTSLTFEHSFNLLFTCDRLFINELGGWCHHVGGSSTIHRCIPHRSQSFRKHNGFQKRHDSCSNNRQWSWDTNTGCLSGTDAQSNVQPRLR